MRSEGRAGETLAERLAWFGADGHVDAQAVAALRRILADGLVDRGGLVALFDLADRAPHGDPAWPVLFAETCADYLVGRESAHGHLSTEAFRWMRGRLAPDGTVATPLALTALVRVMHRAVTVPGAMPGFIADQIRLTVARRTGAVTPQVMALLKLALYAAAGHGSVGITRDEADLLFDLHDLAAGAANAPGWNELFVRGIAAHLMQHVGYEPLPREEALRLTGWAADASARPGAFLAAMLSGGLAAISEAYEADAGDPWARRNAAAARAADLARRVDEEEAAWLMDRLARDGRLDDAQKALLVYLRDHLNAALPEALADLAALVDEADDENRAA